MVKDCGLLTVNKEPVPLKSVEVELEVRDHVATVVSTLNYENKEDKPIEAVFVFPLPGDAAVCHFSATIGQTQIVAEVKGKQERLLKGAAGLWSKLQNKKPEETCSTDFWQPPRDPLLQLVSLQKASGCWVPDSDFAAALGMTSEELEKTKPESVNQEVWATILALIWLHGFKMDAQEEWELLARKAASWLCAQNACVTEYVEAGNTLSGCNVQKDKLGL